MRCVGYQIAAYAWILAKLTKDGPMTGARPDGNATGLRTQSVYELECIP